MQGHTFTDTELLAAARKALYERSRLLSPDATLTSLQDLKVWVGEELAFEEAASTSLGRVLSDLWYAEYLDQLPPLLNKFERLASAYFVRRGSVPAFHGFCNAWREGLLRRVLQFAEEDLEIDDHGHAPVPYALLAAGALGRHEQTLEDSDSYFLVWTRGEGKYFERFSYRILAILDQLGMLGKDSLGSIPRVIWRGSLCDWERSVDIDSDQQDHLSHLEQLADLRHLCGDESLGLEALAIARASLADCRDRGKLTGFAGKAAAAPVALGVFGGIRLERAGEYAGCFNLAGSGLNPLVSGVRQLAMQHDVELGTTLARLEALSAIGALEEQLVRRLQAAYHQLAGLKIGKEIALQPAYLDPSELSILEQQKLRAALEAVRQLQRVIKRGELAKARRFAKSTTRQASPSEAPAQFSLGSSPLGKEG
ncbi:MAG TPA: putative nucleotidyltransferase substrate binding domain-containing protein [Geomonas sp.]|nr:putative nucleotidyltransferase substrate binding domain-containing protein [Geomonas sp.]